MAKGYQSFKQKSTREVYCSTSKYASHAEAKEWVKQCLAHFNIQANDTKDYNYPLSSQPDGSIKWSPK